ncbi:MAG: leucine-rich repeat domain-containing protein [Ruminococcaceae bacterium]|nr:leucine-rich repeat domain-containing protein [Oscillospiraceae bacterium]
MKKIILVLSLALILSCLFVVSVSAEVTTYDDAPAKTKIQVSTDDVVVFDDGFCCPTGYIFKDISAINGERAGLMNDALDFSYINEKTGKTYAFANIVEMDIPQGVTYIGGRAFQDVKTIQKVSIPDTVTGIGVAMFQGAINLTECTFEHNENSNFTSFPTYIFYNTALTAFSMPDCVTKIQGAAHFTSCDNLQGVHLSKKLTDWESGGGGLRTATFDDCHNVYFVNEAFTYDNIPEKPTVYYFPANLENMANQCIFRECQSLNDVLVFGEKLTSAPNEYLFQNGPANKVVFLGDMTTVSTKWWGKTTHVFFANENDVDASCVTFSGGKTAVFCNAEGNTEHLKEKTLATEANCENPKMVADYCFCGALISRVVEEGSVALGHKYDGDVTYSTLALLTAGTRYTACTNGCGTFKEESVTVLVSLGYSASTFGETYSFTTGYNVDREALLAYEAQNGVTVSFGYAFNKAEGFDSENATIDSFKLNAPIKASNSGERICAFTYKMSYAGSSNLATDIIVGAYVVEKSGDGESLTFINKVGGVFEAISYEKVLENSSK